MSDTAGYAKRMIKGLVDAIPLGPHPEPHAEWVTVRLDFVQFAIDHIEWLEKGNDEWRVLALSTDKQAKASRAVSRVAIEHLRGVLDGEDQNKTERLARDWLESVGYGPK